MRVADCVPVLVADEASGDVAAIHAGWRGVAGGVVRAGVERLAAGRSGARLVAAIGPCIGPCCFEVGRDVAGQIERASCGARVIATERGDKAYVDLRAAVRAQLAALGVERRARRRRPRLHAGTRRRASTRSAATAPDSGRMLAAIATRAAP